MKRQSGWMILVTGIACALLVGCQTIIARTILPRDGIREAQYGVKIERDVVIPTIDGLRLVADVYHPVTDKTAPTILVRIPFTKTFKNSLAADAVGRFWATRGYIVVIQGTRGRYKSEGTFYPLVYEREDGLATLKWLARQPWFNGRLGMWGGSANGYTQWVLADQTNPGPNALFVQIASSEFHDLFYSGGAFSFESALFWAVRSRGAEDVDASFKDLERGFNGFPLIEADNRAVGQVPFFDDWVTHSTKDDYWIAIDGKQRARTIKAPIFLMAGWSDPFLPSQLRDYEEIQRYADREVAHDTRLIIGPWTHADPIRFPDGSDGGSYRKASLAPSIPWFDHHLRGQPIDPSLIAPVRIFVLGEYKWRDEQEWPLKRAVYTPFYLHSDGVANTASGNGKLSRLSPTNDESPDTYVYDPRAPVPSRGGAMLGPRAGMSVQNDVEERPDVLVYTTDVLERNTEVTGPVKAELFVSTTARNTDFTVKLVDVHPDGRAYNVCDGILRRDYEAREVGNPTRIVVQLWPTSYLFRTGHRIRVEVSSSNFPRYDRNPNTGTSIAYEANPITARQRIFHQPGAESHILLPLIAR